MTPPTNYRLTDDHLDRGVPGKCDRCPVALCIREQGRLASAGVDAARVWASDLAGACWHAWLPALIGKVVRRVDQRLPVHPVAFVL